MKKFLKKIFLIISPIILWGLIIILIDPFCYFDHSIVNKEHKKSSEMLNTLLYRTIDYEKHPCENMLIGDSRTDALPKELIEKLTSKKWKKLNTNAAKLNEIFDLFYMANENLKIKRVIIGINFNMFNEYGYMDRVTGIKKIQENPFMYIYNKDVAEAAYYILNNLISKKSFNSTPLMTKEEFWDWNISTKATHWYGKYKFPNELHKKLIDFDEFTKANNIEVIFIITPHHQEFHERLKYFGLEEEEKKFKEIMFKLNANVYDYDYDNEITRYRSNFNDPIHYNNAIGQLIVNEIFNNDLKIGITNHKTPHKQQLIKYLSIR